MSRPRVAEKTSLQGLKCAQSLLHRLQAGLPEVGMLEYATVLSNSSGAWFEDLSYLLDSFRNSPYFWPAIAGVVVLIGLGAKLLSK